MKRIIAAVCALMLGLALSQAPEVVSPSATPVAEAVDGYSQPAYFVGSTPTIHQTQYCLEFNGTSKPCYRWVRQGGTLMQGTKAQKNAELPLIYDVCSYGFVRQYTGFAVWEWHDVSSHHDFCYAPNSVSHYHWAEVSPQYLK